MTPAAQVASAGSHSSPPTSASCPRGSLTIAVRKRSCRSRKTSRRVARLPPPRSGPPAITMRVGSPPVCESTTWTVDFTRTRVAVRRRRVLHDRPRPAAEFGIMATMPVASFPVEDLFDRLPDVVFFAKDKQGRYVHANQTLVLPCGKQHKGEILGRTAEEVFPRELGAAYTAQDLQVVRTGAPIEDKLELHLYPGGRAGWCLTFKAPLRGPTGATTGLVGISRDLH